MKRSIGGFGLALSSAGLGAGSPIGNTDDQFMSGSWRPEFGMPLQALPAVGGMGGARPNA